MNLAATDRRTRLPVAFANERIGLFGGSFDPPHAGHLHVAEQALRRLALDRVWWLVTPGNPLKDASGLAPLADRMDACQTLIASERGDRRMVVCAPEARLTTRYTADTLGHIVGRFPATHFVWIMGADNLGQFHRWERWRTIAGTLPLVVIDRPGSTLALHSAQAATALAPFRVDEGDAAQLPGMAAPAWTFLHGPRNALSSTAIRNSRQMAAPLMQDRHTHAT